MLGIFNLSEFVVIIAKGEVYVWQQVMVNQQNSSILDKIY